MWSELAMVARNVASAAKSRTPSSGSLNPDLDRVVEVLTRDYRNIDGTELVEHRWAELCSGYRLDATERALLALSVAGNIDHNFALAFGLLEGIGHADLPSVALALELADIPVLSAGRSALGPASTLVHHDLVIIDGLGPLPSRRIRVADELVSHLLGDDSGDPAVAAVQVLPVPVDFAVTRVLMAHIDSGATLCYVHSLPGTAGLALAAGALAQLDIAYLAIDLTPSSVVDLPVRSALRQATMNRQALIVVLDGDADRSTVGILADALVPVLVVGSKPWQPEWLSWLPPVVAAEPLSSSGRLAIWQSLVPSLGENDESALPAFGLTPEQVRDVANAAMADAQARQEVAGPVHLTRAARVSAGAVGQLVGVRRSTPAARLVDLSVAEPTRQALIRLVGWTRNRSKVSQQHRFLTASGSPHGVAALFTGPPGTGKTFAAHAIAAELGVELLTVDLSAVVDKYIGETQKNLEKVFHAAEILGAVLFFDEADALFGSRSQVNDARDKYANQETAWLLQRMEAFDGLAVLATNLRANLDRAFTRRLSFVIIFDPPDPALRKQLWTRYLQDAQPQDRSDPVDIVLLAEHADLTGGEIKNVVLSAVHAALLADAPLGMGHVLTATAQEFDKLGRRLPALLSTTGTGRPEMRDSQ